MLIFKLVDASRLELILSLWKYFVFFCCWLTSKVGYWMPIRISQTRFQNPNIMWVCELLENFDKSLVTLLGMKWWLSEFDYGTLPISEVSSYWWCFTFNWRNCNIICTVTYKFLNFLCLFGDFKLSNEIFRICQTFLAKNTGNRSFISCQCLLNSWFSFRTTTWLWRAHRMARPSSGIPARGNVWAHFSRTRVNRVSL